VVLEVRSTLGPEGISVDIYPLGGEFGEPLGSTHACYEDTPGDAVLSLSTAASLQMPAKAILSFADHLISIGRFGGFFLFLERINETGMVPIRIPSQRPRLK
jgi:hypothetical protein